MFPYFSQIDLLVVVCGLAGVLALCMVFQLYQRFQLRQLATAQLQAELTRYQLLSMKAQLQPHFLFNTLNTISVLTTESPEKANRMIVLLSDLLRQTLEVSQSDEVTLRRELELLGAYVEIQKMRFGRRLVVSYDVGSDTLEAKVPNLTLQPLVENAIRHGIAKHRMGGRIGVRASRLDGRLMLQVRDDGPGCSEEQMQERNGNGIGLANTSKRLACIYGNASSMKIERGIPGGTVATIVIPYHENGKQS